MQSAQQKSKTITAQNTFLLLPFQIIPDIFMYVVLQKIANSESK